MVLKINSKRLNNNGNEFHNLIYSFQKFLIIKVFFSYIYYSVKFLIQKNLFINKIIF